MQVFRHLPTQRCESIALAIGNFDGMHLGHQALLNQLKSVAKTKSLISSVMTFEPHPREYFTPLNAPERLSNLREKLEQFDAFGVEKVFVCAFNKRFAAITAETFLYTLREKLNVNTVLVGEDFRFGAKRAGSIEDFKLAGFTLNLLPQVNLAHETLNARRVSSTRIRSALAYGNFTEAALMLGRPYSISGIVVHGAKRGREIGFPTANVHIKHERPALTGVYAVKLQGLNAVANLGVRPTISGVPKLLLEVHVLDFNGDLYGQHVHVEFMHKIRDEMKFESLDALKAQIAKDVIVANEYFKKTM